MKNFSKMRQGLSCMVMALLLMLIPADIFAQNSVPVSGIVMDDTNEPVIGAAVMVKGTTTGVITDIDGRYTISSRERYPPASLMGRTNYKILLLRHTRKELPDWSPQRNLKSCPRFPLPAPSTYAPRLYTDREAEGHSIPVQFR